MTDIEYRGQGLNSFLINRIIEEWEFKCDLIYLFANDSAINFYPKFNFVKSNEYETLVKKFSSSNESKVRKINMDNDIDKWLFTDIIENSKIFSKVTTLNNISLLMFYCTSFMKENIYYIEGYNSIVIANFNDDNLYIQEVFGTKDIDLDTIISAMITPDINKIILDFTPKDTSTYEVVVLKEDNNTLFLLE